VQWGFHPAIYQQKYSITAVWACTLSLTNSTGTTKLQHHPFFRDAGVIAETDVT